MIDWSFPPDIQAQYDRVVKQVQELQHELGIKPMTIEERAQAYTAKKAEEQRKQEELKNLEKMIGKMRPPPRWKV